MTKNSMKITFYHYPLCPLSYKFRILFNILNIEIKIIEVNIISYKEISYKIFRLPVFIIINETDEIIIEGFIPMLNYLSTLKAHPLLDEFKSSYSIQQNELWFDCHLYYNLYLPFVFEYTLSYFYIENSFIKITKISDYYLNYIEKSLTGHLFFKSNHMTINDITCFSYIAVFEYFSQVLWYKYPKIRDWYNRLKMDISFENVLKNSYISTYFPPKNYLELI